MSLGLPRERRYRHYLDNILERVAIVGNTKILRCIRTNVADGSAACEIYSGQPDFSFIVLADECLIATQKLKAPRRKNDCLRKLGEAKTPQAGRGGRRSKKIALCG